MRFSGSSSGSDLDDPSFVVIPPGPYTIEGLLEEVARLQASNTELRSRALLGAASLPFETFYALTGFKSAAVAKEQFFMAGGDLVFGNVSHHQTFLDAESLMYAVGAVTLQYPDCTREIRAAENVVLRRREDSGEAKDRRGRQPQVDSFHLFLLMFMYVHGGMMQFTGPFLPGICVSEAQVSRLLRNGVPVVAAEWATLYYGQRSLSWLLKHAGPEHDMSQYKHEPRQFAEDMRRAHIVLALDGGTVKCEKSHGGREQKALFDWSKDGQAEVRVLVLGTVGGVIVEVTQVTGGRTTEVEIAKEMLILERLDLEAFESQKKVRVHLLLDRGFYNFKHALENRKYKALVVTVGIPNHLVAPVGRGHRKSKEDKKSERKFYSKEHADENREVASERWVNEWEVGALKHARLFHRLLDLSILHDIDNFFAIQAALVNFDRGIEPVYAGDD